MGESKLQREYDQLFEPEPMSDGEAPRLVPRARASATAAYLRRLLLICFCTRCCQPRGEPGFA